MDEKTIQLSYKDGTLSGLRIADINTWPGLALAASRSNLAALVKRAELQQPGVYLLLGEDPDEVGKVNVYIGEAEPPSIRLKQHARESSKEWWTEAIVFVSTKILTKAHIKHLERGLWEIAKNVQRVTIRNENKPAGASLPESDRLAMASFIEHIRLILPAMSARFWEVFEPKISPSIKASAFICRSNGAEARMYRSGPGFVVLKDSTAVKRAVPSLSKGDRARRDSLVQEGTLVSHPSSEDLLLFSADATFSSPSAAASVVTGSSQNGRSAWKLSSGKTLHEVEQEPLSTDG